MTSHPRKAQAQARKAKLIANVLTAHGATSSHATALPAASRRTAERLAGVQESSDETWALVIGLLQAREAERARAALRWIADEGAGTVNVEALVA